MTIAKQLTLVLVKEIIAEKQRKNVVPNYAFALEVTNKVRETLDALVADGSLVHREASVNRYDAYELPDNKPQSLNS